MEINLSNEDDSKSKAFEHANLSTVFFNNGVENSNNTEIMIWLVICFI